METIKIFKKEGEYKTPQTEFIELDSGFSTLLSGSLDFGFGSGFGEEIPLF